MQMLVRNKVSDYATWRKVLDDDQIRAKQYGVSLVNVWQNHADPNEVFFLLDIADIDRANEFMAQPESIEAGEKSGVIEGEFYYINSAPSDV